MSRDEQKKNISINPQISTSPSGKITGIGGSVTLNTKNTSSSAGVYFSKPNYSVLYGERSRAFTENSQAKVSGSIDNRKNYQVQVGISFKF